MRFYRVAHTDPPTESDFYSQQQRAGKKPPTNATEDELSAFRRISVATTFARAKRIALRFKKQGKYVVTLDIPDDSAIRSFPLDDPEHYDLDGDPAAILACWTPPAVKVK